MTAAFEESATRKEQAALRSLADVVASPFVAGKKSRKPLTEKQKRDWKKITDRVVAFSIPALSQLKAETIASSWQRECRFHNIGYSKWPIVGFVPIPGFWTFFAKLLLELALMWIESRKQGQDSER